MKRRLWTLFTISTLGSAWHAFYEIVDLHRKSCLFVVFPLKSKLDLIPILDLFTHLPWSTSSKMAITPIHKPTIVKKRTKKFRRHQSDRYRKVLVCLHVVFLKFVFSNFYPLTIFSQTGASPRVLTIECEDASRAKFWCPTSVMVPQRPPSICFPPVSERCSFTTWRYVYFFSFNFFKWA